MITVPGAVGGKTEKLDFDEIISTRSAGFAAWIALWLAMSVSTLLLGLALLWLAPRSLEAALRDRADRAPGPRSASGWPCSSGCRRWPCC